MATPVETEALIRDHLNAGRLGDAATVALGQYGPEVLGFLAATTHSRSDAQEVFSQLCEDLWRGLPAYRAESSFRTWLYVLARNAAHRHRRDPLRRAAPLSAAGISALEQATREITRTFEKTEVRDDIARLRQGLDPDDRMLLILRVDRALSFREIAVIFSDSTPLEPGALARREAALRKRFERVKETLRARAEAAGLLRKKE